MVDIAALNPPYGRALSFGPAMPSVMLWFVSPIGMRERGAWDAPWVVPVLALPPADARVSRAPSSTVCPGSVT